MIPGKMPFMKANAQQWQNITLATKKSLPQIFTMCDI